MNFDIQHIFTAMSPLSKAIALVLVLMAIASVAVTVERFLSFIQAEKESSLFVQRASRWISDWNPDEFVREAGHFKGSPLSRMLSSIVKRYLEGVRKTDIAISPVLLARNEAERQRETVASELNRGLNVLATVGSIAPFVGLLGTVVGIIAAFQGISATGSGGLSAVSAGIAEALVETALGLMVAIPAVVMFNVLTTRINSIQLRLARSAGELLDELESRNGSPESQPAERRAA